MVATPRTVSSMRFPIADHTRKPRKDLMLPLSLLVAGIFLACFLCMVLSSMWYLLHFRSLAAALSDSAYQSYQTDTLTAEQDGVQWSAAPEAGYEILEALARDTGRLCRAPEQEVSLTVTYGDGAVLELWDREVVDQTFGIFFRFTSAEGKVWTYSNDQLSLAMMLNMVQN